MDAIPLLHQSRAGEASSSDSPAVGLRGHD